LSGKAACPEVDGWFAERSLLLQEAREDVAAPPPKEKEAPKDESCRETMINAGYAVVVIYLTSAVNGAFIEPIWFLSRILDLESRLDMLDWCCNEADCGTGHHASNAVPEGGKPMDLLGSQGKVSAGEAWWGRRYPIGRE
jgi:hypothetical protein